MKFDDYVKSITEAVEEVPKITSGDLGAVEDDIQVALAESENKWLSKRLSDNAIYLFNNRHYINVTELRNEIAHLYASKGFSGSGFDKLTEEELIVYKTVKEIFVQLIAQSLGPQLSAKETAQSLFDREIFYA
jgi:hypothetical protein